MKLITLKCPTCGAIANIQGDETIFTCDYCQNKIAVIKPISINSILDGLNDIEQNKYSNFISILEQAMSAGNYKEGYDYCNKALEINPKSAILWENKAICTSWLCNLTNLEEKVGEIFSYLNTSMQINENSPTYEETAKLIASNLYQITKYKINNIQTAGGGFGINAEKGMLVCFSILEICFQIFPNPEYLEKEVDLLVKEMWIFGNVNGDRAKRHNFDAVKRMDILLNKISKIKPNFILTEKKKKWF